MDVIHVHKIKKSICAHFAESPCNLVKIVHFNQPTALKRRASEATQVTTGVTADTTPVKHRAAAPPTYRPKEAVFIESVTSRDHCRITEALMTSIAR